jgi:two-component system cell cycle sensor histidine kinase/response regulator CckA
VTSGELDARLLWRLCQLVLASVAALAVAAPFSGQRPALVLAVVGVVAGIVLATMALLRFGWTRTAGVLVVASSWLVVTAFTWLLGGPRSPSYFAYLVPVLLAVFLWRRGAALALAGLSALAGLAFLLADALGLLPPPLLPPTPLRLWLALAALLVVTAGAIELAIRTVRGSVGAAEERVLQQAAVAALGQRALAHRDFAALLQEAAELVARTIGVEFCKVLELEPNENVLLLRAGVGWREGCVGHARVGTHRSSQAGYTLEQSEPVVVEDFAAETRFEAPEILKEHGVASGISCAIQEAEGPWGVLGAHSRSARRFRPADVHFLRGVANVIAAAVTRLRLEDRVRRGERLEAMATLAGGVAHDFNNLLTVISAYAERLGEKGVEGRPTELAEASQAITEAASQAGLLTHRLLVFTAHQSHQRRPVDLERVVRDLEPLLRSVVGENVEIRLDLAGPFQPVLAEPTELEQVLFNLAANARDAMPDGGTLQIQVQELAPPERPRSVAGDPVRSWLRLRVSDTGSGMDAETRKRIFDPFFTTKGPGRGTGLGLASVHRIVEGLGGEIWVESRPGRGSRFEIDLPCSELPLPVAPSEKTAPSSRQPERRTVLLVEDEAAVRQVTAQALRDRGYEVLEASEGREALSLAEERSEPIDALVSDVVMPGMGGGELCRRIERLRPGLPMILVSGYEDHLPSQRADLPAHARLLRKPYTPTRLLEELRAAIDAD